MLSAGATVVLEPGFARLLDMVPPLEEGDTLPSAGAAAGGAGENGPRHAVISRWASLRQYGVLLIVALKVIAFIDR